jgi:site-specific DNA recombinase
MFLSAQERLKYQRILCELLEFMKYVIYIRVSTEEQKKSGLGVAAQEKSCLDYIARNQQHPYVIFKDEAVSSGLRLEERKGLMDAVDCLQSGDILLVHSRDRFGRNIRENAILEYEIKKKGCSVVAVNMNTSDLDDGIAQLMTTIVDAFAQYERYLISRRTKAALARKKAKGERVGHIPYGFMLDSNKVLTVNPQEQETLKRMYYLRKVEGLPFRRIASILNAEGYRNRPTTNRQNGHWNHGSTSRVWVNYEKLSPQVPI